MQTWVNETQCVEVCQGDRVIGYAIFLSGGWDAYVADVGKTLWAVGGNLATQEDATRAVQANYPVPGRIVGFT